MKQIRISRKARAHGGRPDPVTDPIPTAAASDTRAAAALVARIDAALAR